MLSAVSGTVFDDLTDNGLTPDDPPAGGISVELFLDNGDGILDEATDTLIDVQVTAPVTGDYTFDNLVDGKFHIRQRVPTGSFQTSDPAYYTFDVAGNAVGMLVDNFGAPDPAHIYFIGAFDADPTHLEADSDAVLGGQRDVLIDVLGNANAISAAGSIGLYGGLGNFRFASARPASMAVLQYDGIDTDLAGPPAELVLGAFPEPIDLTGGGLNSALRFDFGMLQVGDGLTDLDIEILVTSSNGSATFTGFIPESASPSIYSVALADFNPAGSFSFTELTSLEIRLNQQGIEAVDFTIDMIIAENPDPVDFNFSIFTPTATITGTKFDDQTGDGISNDDPPLGGVTIDLFLDDGDRIFNEPINAPWKSTVTDANGRYWFDRLGNGTYHIREQVPAGMIQTSDPDVYTFDVVAGVVGMLVDDFTAPDPFDAYFINLLNGDPTHLEAQDTNLLGGERDLLIDVLSRVPGDVNAISAGGSIGSFDDIGLFHFASAGPGTMAQLQYDGIDDDLVGPPADLISGAFDSPIDITAHGLNTRLRVDFNMLQVGEGLDEMDVRVDVKSTGGSASFSGFILESSGQFAYPIPFADFNTVGDFSFAEVTSLDISLNTAGVADVDFEIDSIMAENPDAAGFDFANYTVLSGIHIEKATNGEDADDPTGPIVLAGDSVTWTYVVTNTGNVALGSVMVSDSQGVALSGPVGDMNGDNLLDLDETWTYKGIGTAIVGRYANTGNVVGTPVFEGEPIEGFDPVSDSDPSHYLGVTRGIHIEKATNGFDADDPTGPFTAVGETVIWTYVVTNQSSVALGSVAVTDNRGASLSGPEGDTNNDGLLDLEEVWTYEAIGTAIEGPYSNVGNVIGTPFLDGEPIEGLDPVTDSDPSHYFGITTGVHIEKATNGFDADDPTGPIVLAGEAVTWTYVVTNTGNVALGNVSVTDNRGVALSGPEGDINGNDQLDLGETWTYEGFGTAIEGQYSNVGEVIGTPFFEGNPIEGFDPVNDSDPSHYLGVTTGIHIEKATNGEDADDPTGPIVLFGETITWDYVVTNTGSLALGGVSVLDDAGTPGNPSDDFVPLPTGGDLNGDQLLDPDEIWTYTAPGTWQLGQYGNMAEVKGTPVDPDGQPIPELDEVFDDDRSHFFGRALSSLSGFVYVDTVFNGIKDPVEFGLKNAVVILTGTDDLGNNISQETRTDVDGYYIFSNLLPGTYTLRELQPWAFIDGLDTIGTPGGTTSNDKFSNIKLPAQFNGVDNNFGEFGLRIITKRIFLRPSGDWLYNYDGQPTEPFGSTTLPSDVTPTSDAPHLRQGVVSDVDNQGWTTVTLDRDYQSMVVVLTPNYDQGSAPLVARVRYAAGNSFQIRVDRADHSTAPVSPIDVHYMVVEEGVYNEADHGVTMEAIKFNSTVTDNKISWVGTGRSYINSYNAPVVVGQVMTSNDADPSVFWSRGTTSTSAPSSSTLYVGKHIGEDRDWTRINETIGYIVVESGNGSIEGTGFTAAVGSDTIMGITQNAPYEYTLGGLSSASSAVASVTGMDGADGSWAVLMGNDPISANSIKLAVDEDVYADTERTHPTEQVAYIVFEEKGVGSPLRAAEEVVADDDVPTLTPTDLQPIVTEAIAQWEALVPDADFSGIDIAIADLADSLLAVVHGNTITIDRDAAGHGWFVDQTPAENEEFIEDSDDGELIAVDDRAADRIDLFSVVAHELGHTLDLSDLEAAAESLMAGRLGKGLRRAPGDAEIDAVFALL